MIPILLHELNHCTKIKPEDKVASTAVTKTPTAIQGAGSYKLIKDERHVHAVCPANCHLKSKLDEFTIEVLQVWDGRLQTFFDRPHLNK
jgi:hypothetical protein